MFWCVGRLQLQGKATKEAESAQKAAEAKARKAAAMEANAAGLGQLQTAVEELNEAIQKKQAHPLNLTHTSLMPWTTQVLTELGGMLLT